MGYGGIYVVNLHALIDPDADALRYHNNPVGPENENYLVEALADARAHGAKMLVGWGSNRTAGGKSATSLTSRLSMEWILFA
jgi:hypothetical protein